MPLPRRHRRALVLASSAVAVVAVAAGCGGGSSSGLSGTIVIDGSSTVAPLSEAAAEQFQGSNPGVRVTVGTSGTGGGFEKFCRGESDISDASREIKDEEVEACGDAGVSYDRLTVANDGLSVVVNPDNDWAQCLTVEQLHTIWDRDSDVDNWQDVDPSFPDEEITLFGPGTDSGTFDFFTDAVNGEEGRQRTDYNNVGEDDNATVTGVGGDVGAMGYLGFSFVQVNADKVKAVEIENDKGDCTAPSAATVQGGEYAPLGRPLFVYPSAEVLERPEVAAFLDFYITDNDPIALQALLIPLSPEQRVEALSKIAELGAARTSTSVE